MKKFVSKLERGLKRYRLHYKHDVKISSFCTAVSCVFSYVHVQL